MRHASAYARKAAGHAAECKRQSEIAQIAEPVLEGLEPGDHLLTAAQYRAVAEYIFSGDEDTQKLKRAIEKREFALTGFRFFCDAADATTTLREFSRETGIPETTLRRHAAQLKMHFKFRGNRKLYNLNELRAICANIERNG